MSSTITQLKIALTIKATYLPSWGTYEGVRELIQNAKDAEKEHGAEMSVALAGDGSLVIENQGVTLSQEALLLGETSKADRPDLIGHFGEGLKLGVLALVRAGHKVTILTGDEKWVPAFEKAANFQSEVLVFTVYKVRARNRVRISIDGISAEDWKTFRECFRFLVERKNDESVETPSGTLLMAPRMKGRLYVKGIFVQRVDALHYGYDLVNVPTDRDRKLIHEWDLKSATRRVWEDALLTRPDMVAPFLKLLEANTPEIANVEWSTSGIGDDVVQAASAQFKKRHGDEALPVANFAESQEIGHLGKRGVVVAGPLRAILAKVFGTATEAREKLKEEVTRTYSAFELGPTDAAHLAYAIELIRAVRPAWNGVVNVVDFRSEGFAGIAKIGGGEIQIAAKMLASRTETLKTLVHEVAHIITGAVDGEAAHVDAIENIWGDLYARVEPAETLH